LPLPEIKPQLADYPAYITITTSTSLPCSRLQGLLPGAELSLITGSSGLLNGLLLPFLSILDASCPIFDLHLANVLFDVILPSVLWSSL
jgi:hypothetical protein